jgi:hypothetical protein
MLIHLAPVVVLEVLSFVLEKAVVVIGLVEGIAGEISGSGRTVFLVALMA